MIKVFLVLSLFLAFLPQSNAQSQENKILIEEYLKRSEQQKKTGLILLGAGVGSVILGTVLFSAAWSNGSDVTGGAGVLLMTAGSISTLVSIPVLISSASNGRKAAKVGIGTARFSEPQQVGFLGKPFPALSITLPLNSQKP